MVYFEDGMKPLHRKTNVGGPLKEKAGGSLVVPKYYLNWK